MVLYAARILKGEKPTDFMLAVSDEVIE